MTRTAGPREPPTNRGLLRRGFDWLFRDRSTGKVVIAQWPNVPLGIFLAAAALRSLVHPAGTAGTALSAVASLALLWWGLSEVVQGVNPFRRLLGAAVLTMLAIGVILRGW